MKRSEMIDLIYEEYNNLSGSLSKSSVEIILNIIEKAGMLPPAYMKPVKFESDGKQYPLVPGDFKNEQGIWCTPGHWGWESEE